MAKSAVATFGDLTNQTPRNIMTDTAAVETYWLCALRGLSRCRQTKSTIKILHRYLLASSYPLNQTMSKAVMPSATQTTCWRLLKTTHLSHMIITAASEAYSNVEQCRRLHHVAAVRDNFGFCYAPVIQRPDYSRRAFRKILLIGAA
jgi:hypothetical protein